MFFFALVFAGEANATGNVLLPPENADKSNLPNLGLSPAEPTPQPAPVAETKPPEPAKVEIPVVSETKTPPVQMVKPQPVANPRPYTMPYQPPAAPPETRYSINITLGKTPGLTPNDIDIINTQLGIDKGSVVSSCHIGINGMLITDKGTSSVDSNAATSVDVVYVGALNNALLSVYAACDSAPKPAPYNYIQRMGNKFAVSLGSAFCEPKTPFSGTMHQIIITHSNTGNDSCVYKP